MWSVVFDGVRRTANMDKTFELNGRTYRWTGNGWVDAKTFLSPPGILQQELNHRFGYLVNKPAPHSKKQHTASQSSDGKGIQKTIGPIIVDFVRRRYDETHDFVHRDEIAQYLLNHPEARTFLQEAYSQTEQKMAFEGYVGNQVDWLSANYGDPSRSEYEHTLEKADMADGKKGYRPK